MKPKYIALAGGVTLIIGSLLPWVSVTSLFGSLNKSGIEGEGILTLACGVVVVLASMIAKERRGKSTSLWAVCFGIGGGYFAVYGIVHVIVEPSDFGRDLASGAVGVGIYVAIVGALIAIVGGLMKSPASLHQKHETLTVSTVGASTMPPAPSASVTDRLSELKVMLDKNLVTQDEYDAKRAELLKQI